MAHARSVIVLATGTDEAMHSSLPKVLHPLLGRSLLGHVLAAVHPLAAVATIVVTRATALDQVTAHLADAAPGVAVRMDPEPDGGLSSLRRALDELDERDERDGADDTVHSVVVVEADLALLRADTVSALVEAHVAANAGASLLTVVPDNAAGEGGAVEAGVGGRGGRVVRNPDTAAVEGVLAPSPDAGSGEVTAGLYVFDAVALARALATGGLAAHITDLIGVLVADGYPVLTRVADRAEGLGCVDRVDLAEMGARLRDRVNAAWMRHGVTIVDPTTTWIDVTATIGPDTVVEPGVHLRGRTSIGSSAVVGPECTLLDVSVGDHATVLRSHAIGATVGDRGSVGPYAYLRPGTVLRERAKVGTFVEVKNSDVGAGTKIPHLSYVGDATIGEETNIGAANVVVNYDGVTKHRTVVGSHVRTGSDTMLVAPVTVGDGAYTAAGSVVTNDVPPGALAVARSPQRNIDGWVAKRRSGTTSAQAAAAAGGTVPNRTSDAQPATRGVDAATHGPAAETRAAMSRSASASESGTGDTSSD